MSILHVLGAHFGRSFLIMYLYSLVPAVICAWLLGRHRARKRLKKDGLL